MVVTANCPCGAYLTVEDASEIAAQEVLRAWLTGHPHSDTRAADTEAENRRLADQYRSAQA